MTGHFNTTPVFLLGGCVSFTENCIKDQENFKSEFAKQLNCKVGGQQQFNKTDLEKLKIENKKLQRKIDSCWYNKNKIDTLELEIKLLRERIGKISVEISHQDFSTHKLLSSVHSISRQLSLHQLHESQGSMDRRIKRSKSCFHVNKAMSDNLPKKRSKSSACELGGNLRKYRIVKISDEVSHIKEPLHPMVFGQKSKTSRVLRRVKTFLKPFRKKYEFENEEEIFYLGKSYHDTDDVKVLHCSSFDSESDHFHY